jgi:hypothetical protein
MRAAGFCRAGGILLGVPVAVGCERGCECFVRSPFALQMALRVFARLIGLGVSTFLAHPGGVPPFPLRLRPGVQSSQRDSTPAVCGSSLMHTRTQSIYWFVREAMPGAGFGRLLTRPAPRPWGLVPHGLRAGAGMAGAAMGPCG